MSTVYKIKLGAEAIAAIIGFLISVPLIVLCPSIADPMSEYLKDLRRRMKEVGW